ncbi:MAG: MFS transporter [Patescibacteria group bacterium]|nr:MFS transporter [Patescibacteria group bacterium]MDE2589764.1 MFS transporter [Patescibacteria group bacterium]
MERLKRMGKNTFLSLNVRNYRLYFIGQAISLSGTWMQSIAQGLLVLKLTNSGTMLGLITALQFLPILLFGPFGGVIADRFPKQKILYVTQFCAGFLALILGILVGTNVVQLWMVGVLAFCLGLVNMVDNPTRNTFISEMVGKDHLHNAITLNAWEINLTRVIGPSLAGILAATVGLTACFLLNSASYVAVLIVLYLMNTKKLLPAPIAEKKSGQLREGFAYVASSPLLRNTLIMLAIVGTLTYEFPVILPLVAQFTFHNLAAGYAALTVAMGFGAVLGGLFTANRKQNSSKMLVAASVFFGVSMFAVALSPTLPFAIFAMVFVGVASINFNSIGNVTLQLESLPQMRGRVMSLWTVAFLGSTPIGGPLIGWIGEHIGPRFGLGVGGLAAFVAAAIGMVTLVKPKKQNIPVIVGITDEQTQSRETQRLP